MGSINYIPLRTTSQYSLLEGAMQIESIVNKAINHKIPAIGLTDKIIYLVPLSFLKS